MDSSTSVFRVARPHVIHEVIDGEAILVNLNNGNYYSMDKLGAEVWKAIETGASIRTVVDDIEVRYQAERAQIEAAVAELLQQLQQEGLVSPGDSPDGAKNAAPKPAQVRAGNTIEKLPFEKPSLQKYTDMEDLLALDPIHDVADSGWPNIPRDDA